ncbi:MAG: hypothetical protein ACKO1U_02795 [Bacteroidota bacterium]
MSVLRLFLVLSFALCLQSVAAQQQAQSDPLTDDFAFSVQTIDDFFDRFNFSPTTPFFDYVSTTYPDMKFDRKTIIYSLFNTSRMDWETENVNRFAERFQSSTAPQLEFSQPNWYAVLHSRVVFRNKRRRMDLIMRAEVLVTQSGSIGYRWVAVGVKAPFLLHKDTLEHLDTLPRKVAVTQDGKFLHPMSHSINFMNIHDVFRKGMTRSYYARTARSSELDSLVKWVDRGQIRFLQVDSISYHLLQLPGWIVQVDYFDRSGRNSGWLINRLMPADDSQKRNYLSKQLNIR